MLWAARMSQETDAAGTDPQVRQRYSYPAEAGSAVEELVTIISNGGDADALSGWFRDRLVLTGWLRKRDTHAPTFELHDPEVGSVNVSLLVPRSKEEDRLTLEVSVAALRAALRVMMAIRDGGDGMAFVQSAITQGHVRRVRTSVGLRAWVPVLREGEPFRFWLCAMLAASLLNDGRDPSRHLSVCDQCGKVWMDDTKLKLCPVHRGTAGPHTMELFVEGC